MGVIEAFILGQIFTVFVVVIIMVMAHWLMSYEEKK